MEPSITELFHTSSYVHCGQVILFSKPSNPRRILLTQAAQFQRRAFKLFHSQFQRLLQLVRIHLTTVGQCYQRAGLAKGVSHQFLNTGHVLFHLIHQTPPFVLLAGL